MSEDTKTSLFDAVLNELPSVRPITIGQYLRFEGNTLTLNVGGTPTDPITDAATAKAYCYAAGRLIAKHYYKLYEGRHLYQPPTMVYSMNRGTYRGKDGSWYMLDCKNGRYLETNRPLKIEAREFAQEFNDELMRYEITVELANREGKLYSWTEPLVQALVYAPDRETAADIINTAIARKIASTKDYKAAKRAAQNGEAAAVGELSIGNLDILQVPAGTVVNTTTGAKYKWNPKSDIAVLTVSRWQEREDELEFIPATA